MAKGIEDKKKISSFLSTFFLFVFVLFSSFFVRSLVEIRKKKNKPISTKCTCFPLLFLLPSANPASYTHYATNLFFSIFHMLFMSCENVLIHFAE